MNTNNMCVSIFEGATGKKIIIKKKKRNEKLISCIPHWQIDKNDWHNGQFANYQFTNAINCQWKLSSSCKKRNSSKKQKVLGIIAAYTGEYPSFKCCVDCLENICGELRRIETNPKLLKPNIF